MRRNKSDAHLVGRGVIGERGAPPLQIKSLASSYLIARVVEIEGRSHEEGQLPLPVQMALWNMVTAPRTGNKMRTAGITVRTRLITRRMHIIKRWLLDVLVSVVGLLIEKLRMETS